MGLTETTPMLRFSLSVVTAQLNSFRGRAVGHTRDRPRVSATLVRKSAVKNVHELCLDWTKALENLMCHCESTAGKTNFFA